jgi:hypothetical protein
VAAAFVRMAHPAARVFLSLFRCFVGVAARTRALQRALKGARP